MVEGSTYSRGHLKARLLQEGLLKPECRECKIGEIWRGRRMTLVLDHTNGIPDDHRLENLRLLCPNCAATLDTHCGRNLPRERKCVGCGDSFAPRDLRHRYSPVGRWRASPRRRRPSREATSDVAVARKYGVSDTAIRKWVRQYEREAARRADLADAA